MAPSEFDAFCRFAFEFLAEQQVRFLVVGGLAVVVIGEPRMTADADVIAFLSPHEAESLIRKAVASGFDVDERLERERLATTGTMRFRRGRFQLDVAYLEQTLLPICDAAEDMTPWTRLTRILTDAGETP